MALGSQRFEQFQKVNSNSSKRTYRMQSSSNKGWRRCTFGFLTTQAQPHLLQLSSMRGLPCARPCVAALPRACLPCCCTHVLIRPLQAQHVCFSTQHHPPPTTTHTHLLLPSLMSGQPCARPCGAALPHACPPCCCHRHQPPPSCAPLPPAWPWAVPVG